MSVNFSDLPPNMQKQALQQIGEEEERKKQNSKYNAKKTIIVSRDGTELTFDSVKEANVYAELDIRQRIGEIQNLRRQVSYELIPKQKLSNGKTERAIKYIADFVYEEQGKTCVVDVKGFRTEVYKLKRKLMKYIHDIEIQEV